MKLRKRKKDYKWEMIPEAAETLFIYLSIFNLHLQGVCSLALHYLSHFTRGWGLGSVAGCSWNSVSWHGWPSFLTNECHQKTSRRLVHLRAVLWNCPRPRIKAARGTRWGPVRMEGGLLPGILRVGWHTGGDPNFCFK